MCFISSKLLLHKHESHLNRDHLQRTQKEKVLTDTTEFSPWGPPYCSFKPRCNATWIRGYSEPQFHVKQERSVLSLR